jgi:hypothetical protein
MIIVRFFLIGLIVYLIIRSFMRLGEKSETERQKEKFDHNETKKVSKNIGEYVDFEEIKKDKS